MGEISPHTLLSREQVDPQVIGRLAGLFFAVGALGALATMPFRPLTEEQRLGVIVICTGAFVVAALAWLAPWRQLPTSSTLVLVPVGLLFGTVGYAASINPYEMTAYYVTGFVWIGIAHERGTSMRIMPFMMLVYLIPVLLVPSTDPRMAFSGLVSLTVFCVIVGETLAWLVASLRRVHEELAIRRTATRYRALVQNAADLVAVVGADATIHFVTPSVERLLGYRASELTTRRLTELFADETVNGALQLLERLARQPGAS
ncbi:MAG: PAS domain S-box protein, partial [Chloroflexota bacterium]